MAPNRGPQRIASFLSSTFLFKIKHLHHCDDSMTGRRSNVSEYAALWNSSPLRPVESRFGGAVLC
jgi:hypothetical protein